LFPGLPGSGKSYLAKLIRDKEAENGGTVRIMSIDDYFMQEGEIEEKDPTTGKVVSSLFYLSCVRQLHKFIKFCLSTGQETNFEV
jgi:adenylate kinase family enzyme